MEKFFSCDWGTTAFRIRLVESFNIIADESNQQGIAETFKRWKQSGENEGFRVNFYLDIIKEHITAVEQKLNTSLDNIPVVISGMASSTIGMTELPYKQLPFCISGSDFNIHIINATENFPHKVIIISGVCSEEDVMRGEETKLIGCASNSDFNEDALYIFPGTHSKHIDVKNTKVIAFKTYMTGEFFELLSKKSILSVSVQEGEGLLLPDNNISFTKGVRDSLDSNILHNCFLVRTNDLFKRFSKQQNYYYLSGLLIGTELNDLRYKNFTRLIIVGDQTLAPFYSTALETLNLPGKNVSIETYNADEALIRGQHKVYNNINQFYGWP